MIPYQAGQVGMTQIIPASSPTLLTDAGIVVPSDAVRFQTQYAEGAGSGVFMEYSIYGAIGSSIPAGVDLNPPICTTAVGGPIGLPFSLRTAPQGFSSPIRNYIRHYPIALRPGGYGLYSLKGSVDFTIEFWCMVEVGRLAKSGGIMIYGSNSSVPSSFDWYIGANLAAAPSSGSYPISFVYRRYSSPTLIGQRITEIGALSNTNPGTTRVGQWHHIAIVNGNGRLRMYCDGVLRSDILGETTDVYTDSVVTPAPLVVGNTLNGSTNEFGGRIGPCRIVKGYAMYTGPFTPPSAPFPVPR